MKEIITITISDFLTNELAEKICLSQWHNNSPQFINQIRRFSVYDGKHFSDCFNVVTTNISGDVIGRLYCLKNRKNEKLWYYGDLFVSPDYRRNKIATKMLEAAIEKLKESGAEILRTYVEPANTASINLQKSLGFIEKPYEVFDHLLNEGDIMFELCLPSKYEVIPATAEEAIFICMFYAQNIEALHGKEIPLSEWKEILSKDDPDEQNFLICKGAMPVAWLRVNGLLNKDMAWISMLAVSDNMHRQGIGSFAVQFAEDFVRSKGFNFIGIHTTVDNIVAQNCYKKLGYHIHEEGECTTGDGVKRRELSFHRDHLDAVRMNIDRVTFFVGEKHDFSFINKIGKVFCVFDAMDSGNICFGVERDGKRYFVKYAGVRTQEYEEKIEDAVIRLKNAVKLYEDLEHPYLIHLIDHYSVGNGYLAIFNWVSGEGLRSYWNFVGEPMWKCEASPNYRFRHLPIEKRIAVVDKIMEFHQHVVDKGYVPIDFYDGSMIYDFNTDDFHICDIDFYRKGPAKNDMGKMWGSTRFMSPEEFELGANLDERTVVYLLGATAFELLNNDTEEAYQAWESGKLSRSFEAWSATKALFDVALKATSIERCERYQTVSDLITAWNAAKTVNNIEYHSLSIEDTTQDILKHFNRYQEVKKSWCKQNGEWVLVDNPYIENWNETRKQCIVNQEFPGTINSGGYLFGAFDDNKLIGFASFFGNFMGINKQYLWLDMLHVSYEYRKKGIGRKLFGMTANAAKKLGAKKLYISANSSQQSQAFYRAVGCVNAEEIIPELFEAEPYDVHMEYLL